MFRPRIYHCFVAGVFCVAGPMFLFVVQQQQAVSIAQQETAETENNAELVPPPPTPPVKLSLPEKSLVSMAGRQQALESFFSAEKYEPQRTYKCDPMGSSCVCLEDWTVDKPVCRDLDYMFKHIETNPETNPRPKVTLKIEPNWEYLNRYEPGMYDCPNTLCNVELANTDKFNQCVFVPLKRLDKLNFSTHEEANCSFPVLSIKLPTCVKVSDPRQHLWDLGVRSGMSVVEFHGIPIYSFKDLEMAERSLATSPRPSNVVFCNIAQQPADELANSQDVFIFSGDKIGKGWELQRPFAANQLINKPKAGLRAGIILENFERWHPTRQSYLNRLSQLWLNETDIILSYKPIFDNPRRKHDWVPLFYPDVSLQSFRMPALPAKDRINAVAWFSSECSPDYAPQRYKMTNELLALLPKDLPLHSFGKCKHNMNQFEFKECNGVGYDSMLPDRDSTKECILRKYKFYIAFENSEAEGYITEKLWQGLKIGSMPVYWGSPTIDRYLPTSSKNEYPPLIHTRDYPDMKAVVKHMVDLSKDDERYDKHMQWRKEPFAPGFIHTVEHGRSNMFCNVCDHVAEKKGLLSAPVKTEI